MAASRRANEIFTVLTLVLAVVLLLLVVLSMTGAVSLCGSKSRRRSGSSTAPRNAAPRRPSAAGACTAGGNLVPPAAGSEGTSPSGAAAAPAAPAPAAPAPVGSASVSLIEMEAPQAVEAVRAASRDKVLYVLGQMSCPACQSCKKYLAQQGHGDVSVFVDISAHGGMLKDGSVPRGVAQSLGRGVPCLVAYSHRAGAVLKKQDGFSPKAVEELVGMVKS